MSKQEVIGSFMGILGLLGLFALVLLIGPLDESSPLTDWLVAAVIMTVVFALIYFGGVVSASWYRVSPEPPPGSLSDRISELLAEFRKSIYAISAIEQEIMQRKQLVDRLEVQRQIAERAKDLDKEQVEAIAQILNLELRKESGRAVRREVLVNFIIATIFFILGYLLPL